jgi:hypothetical protein
MHREQGVLGKWQNRRTDVANGDEGRQFEELERKVMQQHRGPDCLNRYRLRHVLALSSASILTLLQACAFIILSSDHQGDLHEQGS